MRHAAIFLLIACLPILAGCGADDSSAAARWTGTIDTLPSGQVVVHNPADPVWAEGDEWQVVEELRIGTLEGAGPEVLGRVNSLAVDPAGRIWVFESQAQELRVFGADGEHIRTIGRRGGGPGEFARAMHVDQAPDGHMWVMDPQNNRISVFDTAGNYIGAKQVAGGFLFIPWPGRFDESGHYYAPVPRPGTEEFRMAMVQYDTSLTPIDTLDVPRDPIDREGFELRSDNGFLMAGVPFQGGLDWLLSPDGTLWALISDQYRLFALTAEGDTLRTITRDFTPLSVTDADRETARENLKWFTDQGGKIDLSKLPDTKPAT
ncbi:MAG: 6-bladed beta-propeller, partial [Longimicrobiales bacterium]